MSKYDQLAFSSRPSFYLAAPTTTDQSTADEFVIDVNGLTAGGQPIIYGHLQSFKIESGATMDVTGDLLLKKGTTVEFILYAARPIIETEIIVGDNGSGIYMTPNSVIFRLTFDKDGSARTLSAQVHISQWHRKMHVIATVGNNQAVLTVNGISEVISIDGVLNEIVTTSIGKTFSSGYYFLLDGLGVYSGKVADKSKAIDDYTKGHEIYAAALLNGRTTNFDTFSLGEKKDFVLSDFNFNPYDYIYTLSYHVPVVDADYVIIETNDDDFIVDYDINNAGVVSFSGYTTVSIVDDASIISFRLAQEVPHDFLMKVTVIVSADIFSTTPAFLIATSNPIFPNEYSDSIVNCPPGVRDAAYDGSWLYSDVIEDPPNSVELVFKNREAGTIFTSSDGSITTGSQSGYSMWLNGVSVVDLTDILPNQWNHLVITKVTPTADTFQLNSTEKHIDYLFLTSYQVVLSQTQIEQLYKVAIGLDDISVSEVPLVIEEGEFENGQAFQTFNNTWAIVGAGGN